MVGLRAALGIDPEKYADFAQLRRKVLQVAKAEIDQLAHFTVEWDEIRRGRAVIELAFRFAPKDAPAQIETVDELARHTSGRKARRDDNVEAVALEGPTVAPELIGRLVSQATSGLVGPDRGGPGQVAGFPSGSLGFGVE